MLAILSIVTIIVVSTLFLSRVRNRELNHFKTVARRLNGEIAFRPRRSRFWQAFLFPNNITLKVSYLHIDFKVTTHDEDAGHNAGWFFAIEAETDFTLLPFTLVKEAGSFVKVSARAHEDLNAVPTVEGIVSKKIIVDNKAYRLESKNTEIVANLINQSYLQDSFAFLLQRFSEIKIFDNGAILVKRWSFDDSDPETMIKLLDCISRICEAFKT